MRALIKELIKDIQNLEDKARYLEYNINIAEKKNKLITVKSINIDHMTIEGQKKKFMEEVAEFLEAIDKEPDGNKISELFDVFQAGFGLCTKCGITAEQVEKGYKKHLEKMDYRPRIEKDLKKFKE